MGDIGELTSYVETNPNDHEKRWRLAKKLYMEGEYRAALGHMLVLQTNWTPKVNVLRYLAATYYRLGRYDEAIAELKTGLEEWPDETPLREQLARVLEVSGRYEDAITVWEVVIKKNPNNSMAKRLLQKLQEAKPGKKEGSNTPTPNPVSDVSANSAFGLPCPSCGERNSEEFDRCWKCHAPLGLYGMPDDAGVSSDEALPPVKKHAFPLVLILCFVVAALVVGHDVMISIRHFAAFRAASEHPSAFQTVGDVFDISLFSTRVATGLILLAAWPLVLWLGGMLMQSGISFLGAFASGVLIGASGYLCLWQAPESILYSLVGVCLLSIVPILLVMRLPIGPACALWLIQAAVISCVFLISIVSLEGSTFMKEFPVIMQYARLHDEIGGFGGKPGRVEMTSLLIPVETSLRWDSTGSTWLDSKSTRAELEFTSSEPVSDLTVEIKDPEKGTLFYEHLNSLPYKFTFDKINLGVSEQFFLSGQNNAKVDVVIRGLTPLRTGG